MSSLTSTKILSQRSAIPAVHSRTVQDPSKKLKLSKSEKERLAKGRRIKGGIVDVERRVVDVNVEAVRASGTYDPWSSTDALSPSPEDEVSQNSKLPQPLPRTHNTITLPSIPKPHEGTSYNPPVQSHQELLDEAVRREEERLREVEKWKGVKERMEEARRDVGEGDVDGGAEGMKVDVPGEGVEEDDDGEEEGEGEEGEKVEKSAPARKTKQQRRKAAKALAEVHPPPPLPKHFKPTTKQTANASYFSQKRAKLALSAKRRQLSHLSSLKSLRRSLSSTTASSTLDRQKKEEARKEKMKEGLGGTRVGKWVVGEGGVDVLVGEELVESLRELKPEGNLFKDRYLSMQQRALIEPRVRVIPKKGKKKVKDYEKHAWKRFE
ncbi:hypothetical protein SISNIDRAFT_463582 [Sistotremastrum niveocremeum HHB9708]|uniref:Ribosome biogenesis protein NOP53 n=1 Tax=Sistotremastrum niveocremeum HHB9708 TaxID=1314777 RepID=A0A164YE82_9AGAM|nr:hypothetical protein SISNIDRAFT_463582 [Sistotremastrum niveocremeum HHB9708]